MIAHPAASGHDVPMVPRIGIQAFCESNKLAQTIAMAGEDRRMSRVNMRVQMGGAKAAIDAYHGSSTPNLVVLEVTGQTDLVLAQLDELAAVCDADTRVILIGHINDVVLYRELISRGVSDYLVEPLQPLDFVEAVSRLFTPVQGGKPIGRAIAVIGAKGGVGASTIAHNIAYSIATRTSTEAGIADLDLPFGTAGLNFNQDPMQGIFDALNSADRVDANVIDRLMTKCAQHLSMLAAPATLEKSYDILPDAVDPIVDAMRAHLPVSVLDIPHAWNGWTRRTVSTADRILIVMTPELASLRNAKNLIDSLTASRPHDAPPDYVLNMVGLPKRPEIKAADFTKALGLAPLASIPFEPGLFGNAANNGQMISEIDAKSKASVLIDEIADTLTGKSAVQKNASSFLFAPLLSRLTGSKKG